MSLPLGSAVGVLLLAAMIPAIGQRSPAPYKPPRTPDGTPDLQGIWEVRNSAASGNLEAHSAEAGIRAGESVIIDPPDGKIPYQTSAAAKQKDNFAKRGSADPVGKCFLPGVPQITYMPYPFQIFQTPSFIAITYEYVHASRTIYMNGSKHLDQIGFWMGDSRGRWEGDTLVVDVKNFNDQTWFDRAGNFHSDALHVVERYSLTDPDHILYEATIEDPKVFTRPWKISMPLYRRVDNKLRLLEYECVFYLQEERFKNAPFK